ncbi:HNH endonuclease signature motif containing protein [Nocardioides sp. SLBN-35]|uniref:HNH endonuclease signature motif containing protein n=1 Tax=Nocardioides sp. SLBN-35 TaxID=2768445 RepID=UPI0011715149|nr:HNH endonuclease signature motif containing protein [Nocardioides sp. SLBN-35]TQK69668.1 HNH endonuclease [Nocardioides sp. SLBN-35]
MSVATLAPPHPVVACAARVGAALAAVADVQPVFMSVAEKEAALVELARTEAGLAELKARILAAGDDIAAEHGARDVAAWFAHATQADPRAARAELHLAMALERRAVVARGMRSGAVSAAQARVIVEAVEELPAELGPVLAAEAEQTLVGYAAHHPPRELKRLGRRILEVVAPEVAEAEEGRRLEEEERRAREKASLRFRDLGEGRTRITGVLPTSVAERWKHYLQAFTSPRQRGGDAAREERVPQHRAYAQAFAALLELLDPARLPEHGGDATTVIVTIGVAQLCSDLGAAGVIAGDGEEAISASEARRLACQAQIIPAVLGGKGEVLDLGRRMRLFSKAQRRALRLRDRRCRAEGCTIPAAWTEAHHLRPWSAGGPTDLANAVSLCSHHHHRVHERAYRPELLADGDVRFARRT